MMKVYIVVATYGEYEDATDEVVKAFTSKEKAEACLKEQEEKRQVDEKQSEKCLRCPLAYSLYKDLNELQRAQAVETFCRKKPEIDTDGTPSCYLYSWDVPEYLRIEEIEVEE